MVRIPEMSVVVARSFRKILAEERGRGRKQMGMIGTCHAHAGNTSEYLPHYPTLMIGRPLFLYITGS